MGKAKKQLMFGIIAFVAGVLLRVFNRMLYMTALSLLAYLLIIAGVVLIVLGCIGCGLFRGRAKPDVREDAAHQEQDEELNEELAKLQSKIRLLRAAGAVCIIGIVAAIIIVGVTGNFILLIVAAIGEVVVLSVRGNYESRMKSYVAENIVKQALEEVFTVAEYKPFGSIDIRRLSGKYFGIPSFDNLSGSDYVRGTYKGLPIEMCDLQLTERRTRTDDEGRTEEYDETVFRGFWLICDFSKELSAELRLWERGKLGKIIGGSGIKTDNENFNKHFHIESEIEHEAFYILTPHMMEYILEMDKKAKGDTHLRFDRDGKVQIAIDSGRDAFEVGKRVKDAALLRRQFVTEIRYVTDIIDELRLVDTLYKDAAVGRGGNDADRKEGMA